MDFQTYFYILWWKKWIILLTLFATMATVGVGTYFTKPIYSSSAIIRIASASGGSISYTDYVYSDRLVNTYVKIATSRPVINELMTRLGLAAAPKIEVSIIPNTELVDITVEDSNSKIAEQAANMLASILIEESNTLYSGGGKGTDLILSEQLAQLQSELNSDRQAYDKLVKESPSESETIAAVLRSIELKQNTYETLLAQYEEARLRDAIRANIITMVEPAIVSKVPVRPNLLVNFGLAFILSLIAGVGLVFVFDYFDKTLHTSAEIEKVIGQTALAKIPSTNHRRTFLPNDGGGTYNEAFRRLRSSFLYQIQNTNLKVIMVTSPEPGDGKSTISANLAILLAQSGKNVLLVDSDITLSKIHQLFNLQNLMGVTNVLAGQLKVKDALLKTEYEGLRILTSGTEPLEDDASLHAINIRDLITDLSAQGDIVLIDSPAILSVADVSELATLVDAVLLVVRRSSTRADILEETRKHFDKLRVYIMGYVINFAEVYKLGAMYSVGHKHIDKKNLYPKEDRIMLEEKESV